MKKIKILMFTVFLSLIYITQVWGNPKIGARLEKFMNYSNENNFVVWIYLKDKGPNAQQLLSNPLNLVSQRSLERRLKVKSILQVVDYTDIPLYEPYVNELSKKVNRIRVKTKWFNAVSAEVTRPMIEQISDFNFVTFIEIVERYGKDPNETEVLKNGTDNNIINDSPDADSLNYGSGYALKQITKIKVNLVHNEGIYGQGVMVASFDAGFANLTHEAFTTLPMRIYKTYDFHTNSTTLTGHSHGTATLSLVGGYKPGKIIGPAFKSTFILARTEVDPGEVPLEMDHWIAAAEWADSLGADVITSSLGYLTFDSPYQSYTWQDMNGYTLPITNGADLAVHKGIIVSNSAGNSGSSTHNTLGGPADGDSVITVGSVDSGGIRSSFSSIGPTTDTPPRIKPDIMAMGSNNYVAGTSSITSYYNGSGTSFSCPLASGVCALVLSANKSLTPIQVRGILRAFANRTNTPDNYYGWGIIDAQKSVDSARKLDNAVPVIAHTQLFQSTLDTSAVTIKTKITDNGIIRNRLLEAPRLYFRKNSGSGWSAYSYVNAFYINSTADSFFFKITGSPQGTQVEYYIAAQDIALPSPKVSTLPAGGSGINPPGTTEPGTKFTYTVDTGTSIVGNGIPTEFKLYNNFPNPFNSSTIIRFSLLDTRYVTIKVYNTSGKEVATIVNGIYDASTVHNIVFEANNMGSGIYFYKMVAGDFKEVRKMAIVR